jgi:phosphatidylserine/phosphatidylglycerophosphate/cardiolipin synthase-like enzyme
LDKSGRKVSILCNLSSGYCEAAAIIRMLDNGASVRSLDRLHAKVLICDKFAIVGSYNFTLGALANVNHEAAVMLTEPADLKRLEVWFSRLWNRSADLSNITVRNHLLSASRVKHGWEPNAD